MQHCIGWWCFTLNHSMCMFFYALDFRLLCIFIILSYFCSPKSSFLLESLFIMPSCRIFFLYGRADSSLSLLALFSFHNTDSLTVCGTNFFVNIASILIIIAVKMGPKCEILQTLQKLSKVREGWRYQIG